MSRELTPRTTHYARERPRPPARPPAGARGPSGIPGGLDVASFQNAGAAPAPPPFPGAALWAEIHRRALAHDGTDDRGFIDSVTARLPCSTCRPHWLAFMASDPPDFGPGYFAWTVRAHNEVNARLGKPVVGLDEARGLWSPANPPPLA